MIIIYFDDYKNEQRQSHYYAEITSPGMIHNGKDSLHYYCIMIDKLYFEERYRMYADEIPVFAEKGFSICSDILKALNTYAFEYSKQMLHSVQDSRIRSLFGEALDMRAVSSDYSVARAQHFMEQHFAE